MDGFVSFRCGLYDLLDQYSSTAVESPWPKKKHADTMKTASFLLGCSRTTKADTRPSLTMYLINFEMVPTSTIHARRPGLRVLHSCSNGH